MSDFDYDIFGTGDVPEQVDDLVTDAAKKVDNIADEAYDIFNEAKEETKTKASVKKAKAAKVTVAKKVEKEAETDTGSAKTPPKESAAKESTYDVFNNDGKTGSNESNAYYSEGSTDYSDEGGSASRAKRVMNSGDVAAVAAAAVAGSALSKSNKVPKKLKAAVNTTLNPTAQKERRAAEEAQMMQVARENRAQRKYANSQFAPAGKKPFYRKWWFWLIALLLLFGMIGACVGGDETETTETTSVSELATTTTTTTQTTTSITDIVPLGAAVENKDGNWGLYKDGELVSNFTGVASNDMGDWYIVNGLVDFGYSGKVTAAGQDYQVDKGKAAKLVNGTTAAPPLSKDEYKAKCQKISYESLARDPDNYKGQYVRFYGQVLQVQETSFLGITSSVLRVATKDSGYGNWYDDVVYVTYTKHEGESNILEEDFVNLYGIYNGTESYTTVLGAQVTIPSVDAEYIELA